MLNKIEILNKTNNKNLSLSNKKLNNQKKIGGGRTAT